MLQIYQASNPTGIETNDGGNDSSWKDASDDDVEYGSDSWSGWESEDDEEGEERVQWPYIITR